MLLALGTRKAHVLRNIETFTRNYFHPAYLIESLCEAYADIRFEIPNAKLGPEEVVSLISDAEDGDESDSQRDDDATMLPPRKYTLQTYKKNKRRGRPRQKRIPSTSEMPRRNKIHKVLDQMPDF